ncbi:MAG: hypothetical protein AAGA60_06745 [Cyanobacteria bacterium P01_E01_bin.42]
MNVFHRIYCCNSIFPTCQAHFRNLSEAIAIPNPMRSRSPYLCDTDP